MSEVHAYEVGEEVRVINGFKTGAYKATVSDVSYEKDGDYAHQVVSVYVENKDEVYRYSAETGLPWKLFEQDDIKDKLHPPVLVSIDHPLIPRLDAVKWEKSEWAALQVLANHFRNEPSETNLKLYLTRLKAYYASKNHELIRSGK